MSGKVAAAAVTVALTAASLVATPTHAFAATTEPVAVGLGRANDTRVLEVTGTASGSRVAVVDYRAGTSGDAVTKQRWTLELSAGGGEEFFVWHYQIRNVLTGKCLAKQAGTEIVVIDDCGADARLFWTMPNVHPDNGSELPNENNSHCLQVAGASGQSGALTEVGTCQGGWQQRWKLRYAPSDCERRHNQQVITALCVDTFPQPMFGVFGNWRSNPITFDPDPAFAGNTVDNFLTVHSLNGQNADTYPDGVEFGLHSEYDTTLHLQTYSAYWYEWGRTSEQYHSLNGMPGATGADGRNHSYMVLSNAARTQWDLLYDFNPAGTTTLQEGGRVSSVDVALAVGNPMGVAVDTPFDNRVQVLDGNQRWRKPVGVGRAETKTCSALPTDTDPRWDEPNVRPGCFTTSLLTSMLPDGTVQIDGLRVAKPGATPARAATTPPAADVAPGAAVVNGVNQRALRACMQADASRCLQEVPGLAACVAALMVCNQAAAALAPNVASASPRMTLEQARDAARRRLTVVGPHRGVVSTQTADRAATTTAAEYDRLAGTALSRHVGADRAVHVITGSDQVRGLAASDTRSYRGYTLVYDAATGVLLDGCLGPDCPGNAIPAR